MANPEVRRIRTDPDPFEPFCLSQGFRIGDLIILSGQAAMTAEGAIVGAGDFDAQAEQTFRNIETLLAAAGATMADIVKVTIYLTDMAHFPKIVDLRRKWFSAPYPADTIVEVRALALPELMIEIEATAIAGARKIG
ncbi:MAG: enamine deaminase RidA [Sphingomonas sp. SCN 67-18]|uniref:RidA family protein n=1 Tax=uncultured Sphingomonas sp. TaxID=158754 RepID=UPI00086AF0A7|nr:RidA family protein [Sphingomonas sp. SCN 67-18]ODU22535.1 MAG: enamine deaminase RidA [Sphingomonas sp. SCN 67-18]